MKSIVILGATGSIGTQTLEVCAATPGELRPIGLSAHCRWQDLAAQSRRISPRWATVTDETIAGQVQADKFGGSTKVLFGESGVAEMISDPQVDVVVAGMVGAAGLRSAILALEKGKILALANKETLIVGGPIVMELAKSKGSVILPVDSEHSAVFQAMQSGRRDEVARIILTASGGPFRKTPITELEHATPQQALKHPTWQMGPKITIDSATMMNKALEIIEAHWLFGLPAEQIEVVIHPQSMVHSFVEFVDGSLIAQASPPDMRLPIQYALTYPQRLPGPARKMTDWTGSKWEFDRPDPQRYPALELGYEVIRRGGTAGAALNAANEVAVGRFLKGSLRFTEIVRLCADVLAQHPFDSRPTLSTLESVDRWARQEAVTWV